MLHEFLTVHRGDLISRCRSMVARRPEPKATDEELEHGIPLFLDQLIKTLQIEQTDEPMKSRKVSGPSGGDRMESALSEIGQVAAQHGRELLEHGFTVEQVVHDYGDLCQAITNLAFERNEPIDIDEFRTLNRCLDNGIAVAVSEFAYQHDFLVADKQTNELSERLGFFAHELRNHLNTATLALSAIKAGNMGVGGATGAVLDRSLVALRNLIDRSLTEVRMTAGVPARLRLFAVADFISELKVAASLEAQVRGCLLTVPAVDPRLAVDADRDLVGSAIGNVLQNAFKFTRPRTEISLTAYASADRLLIDVTDSCGGLSSSDTEKMFLPFVQGSADKTGLGLGLSIARRGVEANDGKLTVRDVPGSGCVFTIDLPRRSMTESMERN